ncbi:MAG: hypothetical protein JWR37_4451 [Mycobacterium sp.]|jgi:hypothetical protein|nr:hypothetical protein [Mycobacterium sp.]
MRRPKTAGNRSVTFTYKGGDLRELVSQGTDDPIILGANRFSSWLVEH